MAQRLQPLLLLVPSGVVLAWLAGLRAVNFLVLLRRTRWILVSLLLIYAFATPGMFLFPGLGSLSPTVEGLRAGAVQLWRLLLLLAALALLLRTTERQALLSGLYVLMKPFARLGVDAERIAVRLWLTLRYAEGRARTAAQGWPKRLRETLEPGGETEEVLRLEVRPLGRLDWMVLVSALALSVVAW